MTTWKAFTRGQRKLIGKTAALVGLLAAGSEQFSAAQEPIPTFRSVNDARPRIPDELDRPVRRETSSHRGWEIREDQFTVAASTSLDDARWAAKEVAKARQDAAGVLDLWTAVHRQPDFGLNSLQVAIVNQPPHERDAPPTTVNVVGLQTQVQLNVAPGQPPLGEQLLRLREGTAFSMLHTAGMDSALPPWVVQGLASHVALIGQPSEAPKPEAFAPKGVPLGGEQWRWQRASQDRLEAHRPNLNEAEAKTSFLLTGLDGKYAPEFISLVRQALDDAARNAAAGGQFRHFAGSNQPPARQSAFDELVQQNQSEFEAWRTDRQAGLPVLPQAQEAAPEVKQAQSDMLLVLKLLRRLQVVKSAAKPVKVITFDRQAGQAVAATPPQPLPTIADLAKRLADPSRPPLATLDTSGRLLLSTDRQRVSELLGFDGQRFRTRQADGKWVVSTRLADGSELCGWLEDNPEKPLRPMAKFSVEKSAGSKTSEQDAVRQAILPR